MPPASTPVFLLLDAISFAAVALLDGWRVEAPPRQLGTSDGPRNRSGLQFDDYDGDREHHRAPRRVRQLRIIRPKDATETSRCTVYWDLPPETALVVDRPST